MEGELVYRRTNTSNQHKTRQIATLVPKASASHNWQILVVFWKTPSTYVLKMKRLKSWETCPKTLMHASNGLIVGPSERSEIKAIVAAAGQRPSPQQSLTGSALRLVVRSKWTSRLKICSRAAVTCAALDAMVDGRLLRGITG